MRKFEKEQAEKPNNTLNIKFVGVDPKDVLGDEVEVRDVEYKLPNLPISPAVRKKLEDQLKAKTK